jgi:class 3 adenylate cyclase
MRHSSFDMNRVPPESERRQATILFADISGFTSLSEKLDPEEVTVLMGECFAIIGRIVAEHGGVIDKFIGDCVMALFGAPKALEGAPRKAIAAAIAMRREIEIFNEKRKLADPLGIHIGINSGEVVSGELGSAEKKDYTVMGDAVNLASRLKDAAPRGSIYVGPLTWRAARQSFRFMPLKPLGVKGKAVAVQVYEVEGNLECADAESSERMIQSVLVGRDAELKRLEFQVMKLVNGEGSLVNLIGEAGIGKSRLCAELFAKDFMKWVTVLEGRALAVGQNLSWYPIIGIIKSWVSISEDDSEDKALLKLEAAVRAVVPGQADEIVSFVATLMGYRLPSRYAKHLDGVMGESLGKIIAKHLKDLIVAASGFKPILFVLEDLHWADESTLELLRSLTALCAKHPVMFLCAWRPGYDETTGRFPEAAVEHRGTSGR